MAQNKKENTLMTSLTSLLFLTFIGNSLAELNAQLRFRRNVPEFTKVFNLQAGLPPDLDTKLKLVHKIESGKTPMFMRGIPTSIRVNVDEDSVFRKLPDKKNIEQTYNSDEAKSLRTYMTGMEFTKVPHINPSFDIVPFRLNYFNGVKVYPLEERDEDTTVIRRSSVHDSRLKYPHARKINPIQESNVQTLQQQNPFIKNYIQWGQAPIYPSMPNQLSRLSQFENVPPKASYKTKYTDYMPERSGIQHAWGKTRLNEKDKVLLNQLTSNPNLFKTNNPYFVRPSKPVLNQSDPQMKKNFHLQNQFPIFAQILRPVSHQQIHQNVPTNLKQSPFPNNQYIPRIQPHVPKQLPSVSHPNLHQLHHEIPSNQVPVVRPLHEVNFGHKQVNRDDILEKNAYLFTNLANNDNCVRKTWTYVQDFVLKMIERFIVFENEENSRFEQYLLEKIKAESNELDKLSNTFGRIKSMIQEKVKTIQNDVKSKFEQKLDSNLRDELINGIGKLENVDLPEVTDTIDETKQHISAVLDGLSTKMIDNSITGLFGGRSFGDVISTQTEQYKKVSQELENSEGSESSTTTNQDQYQSPSPKQISNNDQTAENVSDDNRRSLQPLKDSPSDTDSSDTDSKKSDDEDADFTGMNPENKGVDVKDYYVKADS